MPAKQRIKEIEENLKKTNSEYIFDFNNNEYDNSIRIKNNSDNSILIKNNERNDFIYIL